MDDVHGTHRTAGIVKHPLLLGAQILRAHLLLQLGHDVVDDGASVLAVSLDRALRQVVKVVRVEDVELVQARVEVAVDGGEERQEDGQEAEALEGEAAAARGGLAAGGGLGGHGWCVCGGGLWRRNNQQGVK